MSNQTNKKVIERLREIEADSSQPETSKTWQLMSLISKYEGRSLIIAMRGYPDPDSMASSMAVSYIAKLHGVSPTILYFEDISHYENRALVKQLDLSMVRYEKGFEFGNFAGIIMVDSQNLGMPGLSGVCPVIAIIDHHKLQGESTAPFIDIRGDVGSTCTIVSEYLQEASLLDTEEDDSHKIATAMIIGIRSDTDDFFTATESDFAAMSYLVQYSDPNLLRKIAHQSISAATMEITQRAFANRITNDTFLLSGVGFVREEDRDSIGQAADYLLKREGIDTVIVYGIVNDIFVDGSLRTKSNVVDPDRFIKDVFGYDLYGTAYGGGRRDKGAFKIPLGPFSACTNRELLWRFVKHTVEDLTFQKLGIERPD
jgi:nanoRNase/pAp phosphatase (c-di-AMP/oligoRNAs hydrolase)